MTKEQLEARRERLKTHPRFLAFEKVRLHLDQMFESIDPPLRRSDGTLAVDTAELRAKCGDVRRMIDGLTKTPIARSNSENLYKQLIALCVQVHAMRSICDGLEQPLQHLCRAIGSDRLHPRRLAEAGRLTTRSSERTRASRRLQSAQAARRAARR